MNLINNYGKGLRLYAVDESQRLEFYGEVGDDEQWSGITPNMVAAALGDAGGPVEIWLNSPGGSVFDGWAIYSMIRDHSIRRGEVTVHVAGWAASIASAILIAGDRRTMAKGATVMIHRPWAITAGEAGDLRKLADQLDGIESNLADAYAARTNLSEEQARADMADETFYDSAQALAAGFATEVVDTPAIAALWSPKCCFEAPPQAETADEAKERLLRDIRKLRMV